nr:winged helix-turn-helix transcriptional regulator [Actinospica robiniae]
MPPAAGNRPSRHWSRLRSRYELTPLGRSLLPVMHAIKDWAEAHMDEVLASRADYDTEAADSGVAARDE